MIEFSWRKVVQNLRLIIIGGSKAYCQQNIDSLLLCDRQVEDWLFLHLSVIEGSMNKLQSCLSSAYLHRQTFVSTTHHAVAQFQQVC